MKKSVYITTNFEGYHCWPDAPANVAFLRNPHRHLFGVKVEVQVFHSDRDVEFFTLKSAVNSIIEQDVKESLVADFRQSCEMIAETIAKNLRHIGYKLVSIEVNEDGENGTILKF